MTRLKDAATHERAAGYGAQPGYGYPGQPAPGGYPGYGGYQQPPAPPVSTDRMMSVDDVVVRTISLLAITGLVGAVSWLALPEGPVAALALIGSAIAALVLGLVISFGRITNPALIIGYAVLQGVLLGVVSRMYESLYDGIVVQAVIGTFAIFFGMGALYRFKVLRATPKFRRGVIGAMIGIIALSLVNFMGYLFGFSTGLIAPATGEVSWLAIIFSLVCVVVGALTFVLDFDAVEQGVRYGLPEKYSWYCAFGLLAGLVFVYWELLRLLSYLRR